MGRLGWQWSGALCTLPLHLTLSNGSPAYGRISELGGCGVAASRHSFWWKWERLEAAAAGAYSTVLQKTLVVF